MTRILKFVTLILILFAQLFAEKADSTSTIIDSTGSVRLMLTEDYRFSQSLKLALKWGSTGALSGAVWGQVFYPDEMGISIFLGSIGGGGIGLVVGGVTGYFKGRDLNAIKSRGGNIQLKRSQIGYGSGIYPSFAERSEPSHWLTGYFLTYRNFNNEHYFNEVQLGVELSEWSIYDSGYDPGASTNSYGYYLELLKISRDDLFSPLWGVSFGYANENYDGYEGLRIGLSGGARLNVFDFFFVDFRLRGDIDQVYFQLKEEYDYPINRNFHLGVILGTYIY